MIEVLVVWQVLPGAQRPERVLRGHGDIGATLGERLFVLRTDPAALPALRRQPGVQAVLMRGEGVADTGPALGLDAGEALFVAGWAAQGRKAGPRPGAGRDWDTPGFEPPDRA